MTQSRILLIFFVRNLPYAYYILFIIIYFGGDESHPPVLLVLNLTYSVCEQNIFYIWEYLNCLNTLAF